MIVVDASAVVAALIDAGELGRWAENRLREGRLAAPHLMPVEAANILRRVELAGDISSDTAALAYRDLLDLPVTVYPFEPFAGRVWELRHAVTASDAWYVALAESLETSLVTIDERLTKANGPTCGFETPRLRPHASQ